MPFFTPRGSELPAACSCTRTVTEDKLPNLGDKPPTAQTTTTKATVLEANWLQILPVTARVQEHAAGSADPRGVKNGIRAINYNHPCQALKGWKASGSTLSAPERGFV